MRITIAIKDSIVAEESKRYYDGISKQETKVRKLTLKEAKNSLPKWITGDKKPWLAYTSNYDLVDKHGNKKHKGSRNGNLLEALPYKSGNWTVKVLITPELTKEIKELDRLINERTDFQKNLRFILNSFTTDKKLLAEVPELSKYFNSTISTALVPIDQINKLRKTLKEK